MHVGRLGRVAIKPYPQIWPKLRQQIDGPFNKEGKKEDKAEEKQWEASPESPYRWPREGSPRLSSPRRRLSLDLRQDPNSHSTLMTSRVSVRVQREEEEEEESAR
jgi:hypothetical protein